MGPFLQDGVSEETDFCINEAPIWGEKVPNVEGTEIAKTTENGDESVVPEAIDALNDDTIDKLKVLELRKELGLRGLSKKTKGVLVKRLKEGIEKKCTFVGW